ncbi:MAG: KH domain-containing protein [Synergistaceae bacterium]|nr:KH domain-containing protein [Synergistaceae bacterium]
MVNYKKLVEFIVKHLVTQHLVTQLDSVEVEVEKGEEDSRIKILIRVAHEDVGRVIGKRGATINAIRLLAKAATLKAGERVDVDIIEDKRKVKAKVQRKKEVPQKTEIRQAEDVKQKDKKQTITFGRDGYDYYDDPDNYDIALWGRKI